MFLGSLDYCSTERYLTWKVRVTPAGRSFFQLVPSEPSIEGTDFSLLPTPKARDWRSGSVDKDRIAARKKRRKLQGALDLPDYLALRTEGAETGLVNPDFYEVLMGFPIGWSRPNP
jgi:hypothetical protein